MSVVYMSCATHKRTMLTVHVYSTLYGSFDMKNNWSARNLITNAFDKLKAFTAILWYSTIGTKSLLYMSFCSTIDSI